MASAFLYLAPARRGACVNRNAARCNKSPRSRVVSRECVCEAMISIIPYDLIWVAAAFLMLMAGLIAAAAE